MANTFQFSPREFLWKIKVKDEENKKFNEMCVVLAHTDLKTLWAALQNGKIAILIHNMHQDKLVIFIYLFCLNFISYHCKE